jgi:hypothetical protein
MATTTRTGDHSNMDGTYYQRVFLDGFRSNFFARLLYQILHNTVDLHRYGVEDTSWVKKIRVMSFVFNVKGLDYRHSEQKRLNPEVLDIGFCETRLPAVTPDYSTAKHFLNGRNKMLGRNQPKMVSNPSEPSTTLKVVDLNEAVQLWGYRRTCSG